MPSSEATRLRKQRERLREEHLGGASGLSIVHGLSDATDFAIREIWGNTSPPGDTLVVAVGGYGRRELSPFSDIDLIFIHPKPARCAAAVKTLSYELWDAGLDLGTAIYAPKDCIRLAKSRFDVATALIDSRLLGGDQAEFARWKERCHQSIRKGFEDDLRQAISDWRATGGDARADLEPDIKLGRGGLRDLAASRWLSLAWAEGEDHSDLLFRIRNQLHFMTGRRTDRLLMQFQTEVASALEDALGYDASQAPEDALLRSLYGVTRRISSTLDKRLFVDPRNDELAKAFRAFDLGQTSQWEERARRKFFEILRGLPSTKDAFWRVADDCLGVALPEWLNIQCLPQRNVYHRFAVDVHTLEVVAIAANLQKDPDDLTRRVAIDSVRDLDLLLLACLFHDIGKGQEGDHSDVGAEIARSALMRIGIASQDIEDVVWLVGNHLLLAETATRRDIGDESLIIEIAERAQTERRLRLLFLLTISDGIATGPTAWSKWKSTLVARLFTAVNRLLEKGELAGGNVTRLASERAAWLIDQTDAPPDSVRIHVESMPREWLLSQDPESLKRQTLTMLHPPARDEVTVSAEPREEAGICEVIVVAQDRPGLFSKISGVLALHGLNVLGAQIFTRQDGVALETFLIDAGGHDLDRFQDVAADAQKVLRGRLSLDSRLAQKRKDYSGKVPKGKQEPPLVVIDNKSSDYHTIVEVHSTDRPGLLYLLTKAMSDLGLNIHLAKVSTYAEDVVDAFYVTDLDGQKVDDLDHAVEIERAILHRIEIEA